MNVNSAQQYQESFSENNLGELQEQLGIAILTPRPVNFDAFCNNINQIPTSTGIDADASKGKVLAGLFMTAKWFDV